MSKFVRPETRVLTLSDGDTITVKRRLSTGEERAAHVRMYTAGVDGAMKINPLQVGLALVAAFLVDWTLRDEDGEIVPIRGVSREELEATLNSLDPEWFHEIRRAIEQHEHDMLEARAEEKKRRTTPIGNGPISPSPSGAAGASTGFGTSIPTTTPPSVS